MGKFISKIKENFKESYDYVKKEVNESRSKGWKFLIKDYISANLGSSIFALPALSYVQFNFPEFAPFLEPLNVDNFIYSEGLLFLTSLITIYPGSKLRKATRHGFGADKNNGFSLNTKLSLHDAAFQPAVGFIPNILSYASNIGFDLKTLSYGSVRSVGNIFSGFLGATGIDLMDVLLETDNSGRFPKYLSNLNKKIRYLLAAGIVTASGFTTYSIIDQHVPLKEIKNEVKMNNLEKNLFFDNFKEYSKIEADSFFSADWSSVETNFYLQK